MAKEKQEAECKESLPSRGAWIEMILKWYLPTPVPVAPLAGSVDRNREPKNDVGMGGRSLPSRGAWIEIRCDRNSACLSLLSLPSRGAWIEIILSALSGFRPEGRSPRGERG